MPPPSEGVGEEVVELDTMGENDALVLPVPALSIVEEDSGVRDKEGVEVWLGVEDRLPPPPAPDVAVPEPPPPPCPQELCVEVLRSETVEVREGVELRVDVAG